MLAASVLVKGSVAAATAVAAGAVGLAHVNAPAQPAIARTSSAQVTSTGHPAAIKLHTVLRRLEHGQFTVARKTGSATYDVQRGHVTAVDATSLVVTSADAFTGDYALTPQTRIRVNGRRSDTGALHVGDRVAIVATGGHALAVLDRQPPADTGSAGNKAPAQPSSRNNAPE